MADREESPAQRINRELDELLAELRVALPGVQVTLAFLLTVPFSDRYAALPDDTKAVYVAAVALTSLSSVLLIAPTMNHRLTFRSRTKEELLATANRLTIAGMTCLALGLGAGVHVALDAAYPGSWVRGVGAAVVVAAAVIWFVLPLRFGRRRTPDPDPSGGPDRGS